MTTEDIVLIVNPTSGRGKGEVAWRQLEANLTAANRPYRVSFTTKADDATSITLEALRAGAGIVVAVGGDGTANEVINGFFERGRLIAPQARVAFVSAGTGNDVGRDFQLRDVTLVGETTVHIDVLRVRYSPSEADGSERYAVLHAAIGLVTEVAQASDRFKGRLGRFAYTAGTASALVRHKPRLIRLSCDGGPIRSMNLNFVFASNSRFAGGGMLMAPMASMEDGMLDVITAEGASKPTILRLLPAVYRGAHLGHPAVGHVQARTLHLSSDEALPVETDGELTGTTPVWIDVLPRALPVCM